MNNIYRYVIDYGDRTFLQVPFNSVDALAFACFIYLPYDKFLGPSFISGKTFYHLVSQFLKDEDSRNDVVSYKDIYFAQLAYDSPRYKDLLCFGFFHNISDKKEEQFAVISFLLPNDLLVIAFSGTDLSWAGWKENFNMTFMDEIPAQRDASFYVSRVSSLYPNRKIIITGHSKGGNLAMFAGAFCKKEIQQRIIKVYNFDGPGFLQSIINTANYQRIKDKINTIIPENSIVGMILEHNDKIQIIQSKNKGIFQHDQYSWNIINDKFVRLEELSNNSKAINKAIRKWMVEMTLENRQLFVDMFYKIIRITGTQTTKEFLKRPVRNIAIMFRYYRRLPKKTRRIILKSLFMFKKYNDKYTKIINKAYKKQKIVTINFKFRY